MSATAIKASVISLSEGFGALVVKGPNIEIEVRDGGKIIVRAGVVETASLTASLSSTGSPSALKIGAAMPDGTIYAGLSPDTGREMYTTPKDAPLVSTFNDAGCYAAKLYAHGHRDWRPPTEAELSVLFQNRAPIGNFCTSDAESASRYWSSSEGGSNTIWTQRFSDGYRSNVKRDVASSLRCVRG